MDFTAPFCGCETETVGVSFEDDSPVEDVAAEGCVEECSGEGLKAGRF